MSQIVTMPQLGETVTEGTILRWLVQVGDDVKEDDPILEISTDKVDTEVPSPFTGQVTSCLLYTSPSPRDRTRCRMPSSA